MVPATITDRITITDHVTTMEVPWRSPIAAVDSFIADRSFTIQVNRIRLVIITEGDTADVGMDLDMDQRNITTATIMPNNTAVAS
jgi:hypothetical protein